VYVLRLAELDVPNVDVSLRVSPHDVVGLAGDGVYGAQTGLCWNLRKKTRGFFYYDVRYSTLLHLPLLRFHCVGGCQDRTQDCCDFGIGSQTL
jgi:hypothetical protein